MKTLENGRLPLFRAQLECIKKESFLPVCSVALNRPFAWKYWGKSW